MSITALPSPDLGDAGLLWAQIAHEHSHSRWSKHESCPIGRTQVSHAIIKKHRDSDEHTTTDRPLDMAAVTSLLAAPAQILQLQ